jgi:hypothetical protein
MEQKSIWDKYNGICKTRGMKVIKKCAQCTKSQVLKDAKHHIAKVEEMEQQEDMITIGETAVLEVKIQSAMVDK